MDWKFLNDESQIDQILENSKDKTQIIFKHSTSCSISTMAKMRLETKWDLVTHDLDIYYLDLLSYRNVSSKVAEITGVHHESPQIIIIRDGLTIYDASHFDISVDNILEHINYIHGKV